MHATPLDLESVQTNTVVTKSKNYSTKFSRETWNQRQFI